MHGKKWIFLHTRDFHYIFFPFVKQRNMR